MPLAPLGWLSSPAAFLHSRSGGVSMESCGSIRGRSRLLRALASTVAVALLSTACSQTPASVPTSPQVSAATTTATTPTVVAVGVAADT